MNHFIEFSIYKVNKNEYPRMTIDSVDENGCGSGTRIYGSKFNDFSSIKEFKIPLNIKRIDEIIIELQRIKKELEEELK